MKTAIAPTDRPDALAGAHRVARSVHALGTARPSRPSTLGALLLIAAVAPLLVKGFLTYQLTMALVYAIAIAGLHLLIGISGQISLGHGAFLAVGAYTTALGVQALRLPHLLTIPLAATVAFACGVLFRLPTLRLDGVYLALATFALGVATPQLLKSSLLARWTGGVQGIVVDRLAVPPGVPLGPDQWLYLVVLAVSLALFASASNLVHGRTGRALVALRDHPSVACSVGIDVAYYKSVAFGVGAAYAGVAGALSSMVVGFVSPDGFTFMLSIVLFVGLVVGGLRSTGGAVFGGVFILFVPNVAEGVSRGGAGAVYGLILILVVYVMPGGAADLLRRVAVRMKRRRGRGPSVGGVPW
jgi:branched-chain amino acid transport system permease protein